MDKHFETWIALFIEMESKFTILNFKKVGFVLFEFHE